MIKRNAAFEQMICQPEDVISKYNLMYANEQDLIIHRKRKGKNFIYVINGEQITDNDELERIKKMVIPPMWEDVKISHLDNSHLQVVGRDAKNRKQYLYHSGWSQLRNCTKFYKMYSFGKMLPIIRKQIDRDLNKKGWPKEKVVALVIRLMEETHIRIGNSHYEKENKTYGLTTLRKKHINIHNNKMKIQFVGKKGVEHIITVHNKRIVKLVNSCEELPGWELFKFFDDNGEKKAIKSNHINEYLQDICGKNFTAKDFRTWSASLSFFNALLQLEKASSQDEIKSNVLRGYEFAAAALGNTKNVCRKYYVHPIIVENYESGKLYKNFERVRKDTVRTKYFSAAEKEVIKLFKTYEPQFQE